MRIRLTSAGKNSRCGLLTAYCKAPISVQIESIDSFVITTPSLQCQKRKARDITFEKSGNITCDLTEPDHASCLIQCYKGSCGASFEK